MKLYLSSVSRAALLLAVGMLVSGTAQANPEDPIIAAGAAGFSSTGKKLDITQSTDKVVIDWRKFDIAPDEHTQFHQPGSGSVALNRIHDGNPSQILGKLSANGNIMIINPSGVMFGKDSQVDVNGLVATTSNITNGKFMAGDYSFETPGNPTAAIVNEGHITARDAGLVGLVAPNVTNKGTITAKFGKVQLASGDAFSVDLYGDGLMNIALSDDVTKQIVSNSGQLSAEGGAISMTAATGAHVVNSLITIEGELKTASATAKGGKIIISGDTSTLSTTGTLDASGTTGGTISISAKKISQQGHLKAKGSAGAGGDIAVNYKTTYLDNEKSSSDTSGQGGKGGQIAVKGSTGSNAFVSGIYTASSATHAGGRVNITAKDGDLKLFGSRVSANGKTAGGTINIGGEYQGTGSLGHAKTTSVNFATSLSANAIDTGKGGQVVVWSDDTTLFGGKAYTRGGALSGDGGLIEISSKDTMKIAGNAVTDAASPHGAAGSLLLDPKNIIIATGGINGGISAFEFINPDLADAGLFGESVMLTSTGNVIIQDFGNDFVATDAGAIYLFNGATGALISSLYGGSANDQIGRSTWGPYADARDLFNGNYIFTNNYWDNGGIVDAGSFTWFDGTNGVSGIVGASNSLVGSHTNDLDDAEIDLLTIGGTIFTGNAVIRTENWDNGAIVDAGAMTWIDGTTGKVGVINSTTSLVGSSANDHIGFTYIEELNNGNFILTSRDWDNGGAVNAGASTWVDGTLGITGVLSAANSFVGTQANDFSGMYIVELTNGYYVLGNPYWDNGGQGDVGASTLVNGTTGITGTISAANSLIGVNTGERIGNFGVLALTNGNYVISSIFWSDGITGYLGAATWVDGNIGMAGGTISAANSLIGTHNLDTVGAYDGLRALDNGNYIVISERWNGGGAWERGAVTWGNGLGGTVGAVSAANSLVGSTAGDRITLLGVLDNGNYLVGSTTWDNVGIVDAGAIALAQSDGSTVGVISATNALVGGSAYDQVGSRFTELANGNYVVDTYWWDNGLATDAGAVTWADGTTGATGVVSAANSLVGTVSDDHVGYYGIQPLDNGNYLIFSQDWDNGGIVDAGFVRWADGLTAITGVVNNTNSLVGTTTGDFYGAGYPAELANGNYVIFLPEWDNGSDVDAGAVVWNSGLGGVTGNISAANALVGTTAGDRVGSLYEINETTGNYFLLSNSWDDGVLADVGAVTWVNGLTGLTGAVSVSNSLIGTSAGDSIGSTISLLSDGNYVVGSGSWDNGADADVGAFTWIDGTTGLIGHIDDTNSILGSTAGDMVGSGYVEEIGNGQYAFYTSSWDNGADADVGAATFLTMGVGTSGYVSAANSYIGLSGNGGNSYGFADGVNHRYIINFTTLGRVFSVSTTGGTLGSYDAYADSATGTVTLDPLFITAVLDAGTNVTLQASNDITVTDAIIANNGAGDGGTLTLQAGRSILINNDIVTDNGDLNIFANENLATGVINAQRNPGAAVITMASGTTLDAGTGNVTLRINPGTGKTNRTSGDITLATINANTITALNRGTNGDVVLDSGSLNATAAGDSILLSSRRNFINNVGGAALNSGAGRWLVYSTNPTSNTENGLDLAAAFTMFNCSYGSCGALGAGNGLLYSFNNNPAPPAEPADVVLPPTFLYVSQTPLSGNITYTTDGLPPLAAIPGADGTYVYSLLDGWIYIDKELVQTLGLKVEKI